MKIWSFSALAVLLQRNKPFIQNNLLFLHGCVQIPGRSRMVHKTVFIMMPAVYSVK